MSSAQAVNLLVALLFCSVIFGGASAWMAAIRRRFHGEPILECESRPAVPWGMVDVALFVGTTVGTKVASLFIQSETKFELNAESALANAVVSLVFIGVSIAFVLLREGATLKDIGVNLSKIGADLKLGVVAFVMIAPPVYAMQALLTQWWPTEHPLIVELTKNPSTQFFIAGGISAVIAAPLAEEYMFRTLLQGWLEKAKCGLKRDFFVGASLRRGVPARSEAQETLSGSADKIQEKRPNQPAPPLWPILVSASLFSFMHYSHGPDSIPLFFFAIGLGYLYRQTHRILPCIIVHCLLNAVSFAMLILTIYQKTPA